MLRLILMRFLFLSLIILVGSADAQDASPSAADSDTQSAEIQATEQTVKVDGSATDNEIGDRLRQIYEASQRYKNLEVEVRDGIVFLRGQATSEEHKQWAGELARRTEDVVAVVNNLTIEPLPVMEQLPIQQEATELWRGFLRTLPYIGVGLVVLVASILLAGLISRLVTYPLRQLTDSRLLHNVTRKLVAVLIVIGGVVLFLRLTGLTGIAVTVVSGTGILGLILGFAFRDIAENFLASILLSIQTPFNLGDVIEVAGYTGVVRKVTTRGTVLVDFDGNHIQIANATVYKSTIKNLTANPNMRLSFSIGIGYDASVSNAQEVALQFLQEHSAVLDDPEPLVLVDSLGASTINLKVYFWINGHKHSVLKMKSSIMRRVLRAVEQAGISLPDEAREIIFPQGVPLGASVDQHASEPATLADSEDSELSEAERCQREVAEQDLAEEATEAEGDLLSEVEDLNRQADMARDPESGKDILEEKNRQE
jgi:small-conductance mechanosensitive channel